MTFFNKPLGLAAILAATVSTGALAQDVSVGGDTGVSVGAGDTSVSTDIGTDVTANEDGLDAGTNVNADVAANDSSLGADIDGDVSAGDYGVTADARADVDADSDMTSGSVTADSGATGTTDGNGMTAIRAGANVDIAALEDGVNVDTMTVSELRVNEESIDTAEADFGVELSSMRDQIAANADLVAALQAEGFEADDAVSVWQTAEGNVAILVDDRS